jgi:hypothetical protein
LSESFKGSHPPVSSTNEKLIQQTKYLNDVDEQQQRFPQFESGTVQQIFNLYNNN